MYDRKIVKLSRVRYISYSKNSTIKIIPVKFIGNAFSFFFFFLFISISFLYSMFGNIRFNAYVNTVHKNMNILTVVSPSAIVSIAPVWALFRRLCRTIETVWIALPVKRICYHNNTVSVIAEKKIPTIYFKKRFFYLKYCKSTYNWHTRVGDLYWYIKKELSNSNAFDVIYYFFFFF